MDHLLLVSETGHIVTCLCGNYQVSARERRTNFIHGWVHLDALRPFRVLPRAFLLLECSKIKAIVIAATFISPYCHTRTPAMSLKYIARDMQFSSSGCYRLCACYIALSEMFVFFSKRGKIHWTMKNLNLYSLITIMKNVK